MKCPNTFRIHKLDFQKAQSLVIGNLVVKAFHNNVYLVYLPVCKSAVYVCRTPPAPHVCLLIRCRYIYDVRQWNSNESHEWNVVISVGWIFLWNALYVAWQTKKNWAFSFLVAAISTALPENFVRSKCAYSGSQFLLYWMRIICCIYKDFVWQLKAFFPSFCHSCACEMSPGWGHLTTRMDPSVGHLNSILAQGGGNLNNNFQKSQMPGALPGGGCWSFDLTDTLLIT